MNSFRDLFARICADGEARHALRSFNLAPNVDRKARSVKELAEKLGLTVVLRSLPRGMAGRLVQDAFSKSGYMIEINDRHSREGQRWAVLHELGHYFLHVDRSDPFAFTEHLDRSEFAFYQTPEKEREANQFAAVLLFGDGALAGAVGLYGQDIDKLAKHFGVSRQAIEIALKQFLRMSGS